MQERRKGYEDIIAHMAKTNEALSNITETLVELKEAKKIQNGRIGKLENWRSWMIGGMAAIGALVGIKTH
jgi:hypothetical protein